MTDTDMVEKSGGIKPIDWIQLVLLCILSPLFIFPKEKMSWIFLIIPILWILKKLSNGRFLEPSLLDIPILLILTQILLTTIFVANPIHSFPKVAGFLLSIGLYYALVNILKTKEVIKGGIFLLLTGSFLFSILGLLGMFTFRVKHLTLLMKVKELVPFINFKLPGAEEGFHPNAVGGTLILILPLFAVLIFDYIRGKNRDDSIIASKIVLVLTILGLVFTASVLLLTQSRGAWLGLLVSSGILVFLLLRKKKVVLIGSVVAILIFCIVILPSVLKIDQVKLVSKQGEGTLLFRIQMWDKALPRITENPILGIGMNEFRYLPDIKYRVSHTHNKFFHLAVELGILALAAYLALLFLAGYMIISIWQRSDIKWMKSATLGLGCGQLAFVIFEMTDVIPFGAKVGVFPWISLAVISSLYNFLLHNNTPLKSESQ
jgi:O-antigen ligase